MKLTLPDKSVKELPKGVTGLDVAMTIGPGLAKSAIAVNVDGDFGFAGVQFNTRSWHDLVGPYRRQQNGSG